MRHGVSGTRFKPASAAWELWGLGGLGDPYVCRTRTPRRPRHGRLLVAWDGRIVPLPVAILHPDCRLAVSGDVGHLGVPRRWASARLVPYSRRDRRFALAAPANA